MAKKKKEHVTFDRMVDKRIKINKKAFIQSQKRAKNNEKYDNNNKKSPKMK